MISGTDSRFKNLEKKVGLFVLAAIIGVICVVLFIVIENDMFASTFTVRLTALKGTGYSQGMPIKLSGFRIGRVKSTTLNDSAAVDVVLQIDKKYRKWIRKDSEARLIKEGMIGDYIIEISGGTSPELIAENGVITLGKSKAFDEIAEEIAEKVKPVLMDIRDIIAYVNSEDGDVKQTLRNLNTVTANLETTRQHADTLIQTGTKTVDSTGKRFDILLTRVDSRVEQSQQVIARLDNSLQTVEQKLPDMLVKLDKTLTNIESVSHDARGLSSQSIAKVPRLMTKAETLVDQGNDVLWDLKQVWPLSSVTTPAEKNSLIRRDSNE